ncbi:MAG: hypothetical protein JXA38_05305 [Methanosarcinaceae archaeon]|nr:hypothetical protein [Methanosarcinaceae archaeon]
MSMIANLSAADRYAVEGSIDSPSMLWLDSTIIRTPLCYSRGAGQP